LEASGGRVLVIGVGTSGCRIAGFMQQREVDAKYMYASLDEEDLFGKEGGLNMSGWDDSEVQRELEAVSRGSSTAFVVAGLGGSSGSYLAPRLAKACSANDLKTISVLLLPFKYQKWMEYRAGVALEKVRKHSDGVLTVDREQFVEESVEELPLNRLYEMIDGRVADALEALLIGGTGRGQAIELRKLLKMMESGQATLEVRDLSGGFDEGLASLVRRAYSMGSSEVDEVLIYSNGCRPITFDQARFSSEGLKGLLGEETRLHYGSKLTERRSSVIAMIASLKRTTKLRVYDPVAEVLGDRSLDDDPEQGLDIDLGIPSLD